MSQDSFDRQVNLSVVIPCYNEALTLNRCVQKLHDIADAHLALEIIIVDDGSTDNTPAIAAALEKSFPEISVLRHDRNRGKGAALRSGFGRAGGEFVAIQDADLEYDPRDLRRLLLPLVSGEADVVFGSRFLSAGAHRVLYFWHSLGNRFLTFLSNMFTDLNLTDMESCYKVFRREVLERVDIKEDRFGFEPEIVAKVAHMRLRVFEMGISYYGRTYAEGKKVGAKDGLRALYCILRYNAHRAPLPIQFVLYAFIGALAAGVDFVVFYGLFSGGLAVLMAAPIAYVLAAGANYLLCVTLLFRKNAKWNSIAEMMLYILVVAVVGGFDLLVTIVAIRLGVSPAVAKIIAIGMLFLFNFVGRRFLVFPEPASGPWQPQSITNETSQKDG
jgi:dolichol-phosphate mannosyltransferase